MATTTISTDKVKPVYGILVAISVAHLLNDLLQAVIPAVYPILKEEHSLTYAQIGMITLVFQLAASMLQPVVGAYTDKHPKPYSQIFGMTFTFLGTILLAYAHEYYVILIAVALIGTGSSVFHPESSRVASVASGGKRSLAQSIFQIGGNTGTALAPLLIAMIVLPSGQANLVWFAAFALAAQFILVFVAKWYKKALEKMRKGAKRVFHVPDLSNARIAWTVIVLLLLIISKYFYTASITNYFQFYTMSRFGISQVDAQVYLFYYLIAVALGTLLGGIFGDRFGRKYVIWFSVLGAAPFALLLPYVDLFWTGVLIVIIGVVISSAFPAIIVYAQELLPKKLGMVSGLFYGFAFGMAGVASAFLGWQADKTSIETIYHISSFLPLIGLVGYFLPDMKKVKYREV